MRRPVSMLIMILVIHVSMPRLLTAQNAPVTTLTTVINAVPGSVTVPVTVVNFSNIGAISLTFDYSYNGLHFVQGSPNPALPGFLIGDNDMGNGTHRVTMGWFGTGASLSNGSTIMTLTFTYISGTTYLEWFDNGPSCEYANASNIVLNDVPDSYFYINGYVCGNIANPGTITGNSSVCRGQTGLAYSVSPMSNITGYVWTVPPGASITSGNNTNSITIDYSTGATSGNVTVHGVNECGNGPVSSLPVTVNALPVANAGNDTTIPYGTSTILHAFPGGTGSFSYHWSPEALLVNPDVQNPQTVILTMTTVFKLLVTNLATFCGDSDQVVVMISGGPLSVNPTAVPEAMCSGETSQLYANAGGGSGNYTYSWTCTPPDTPPWTSNIANPVVSPDSSKTYQLSVFDGFNTITGSTSLTVWQLSTATLSGGDTLCGEGGSTTLTVDLTGTPPWTFIYSDGLSSFTISNQYTTPYLIVTSTAGTYTILSLSDGTCDGLTYGQAIVAVFPVPQTPVITWAGNQLFSSSCCGNQWYKDGVLLPGATNSSLTPVETAHYCDIVTLNSCASDTSNDIYFVMTGLNNGIERDLRIVPNPASTYFELEAVKIIMNPQFIEIYSAAGTLLKNYSFQSFKDRLSYRIDISDLVPGLYFVLIKSVAIASIHKLIIVR
jgi:hypothetical protein